jgi:hypothetical protein
MFTEGYYTAQILPGVTFGLSNTGTEQIVIPIRITHDSDGQELTAPATRYVYLYCSEKALPHTIEKLERLDFNGNFESPELSATETQVRCTIEEYNGKDQEKWDIAKGGAIVKPADRSIAKRLTAKYRAITGKSAPTAPRPPIQAPPTTTASAPVRKSFSMKPPAQKVDWRFKNVNDAMNAVMEFNEKKETPLTDEAMQTKWTETLNSIVGDKLDEDVTPAEWEKIVTALTIPDDDIPF